MNTLHAAFKKLTNAAAFAAAFLFVQAFGHAFAQAPVAPPAAPPGPPAVIFVSIGDKPAVSYDSPSRQGVKQFIYSRFHPLEVLVRVSGWTKVRDAEGGVGWVEGASLGTKRFVMVQGGTAQIRATAQFTAPVTFEAERGVVLEATGAAADGWLPVTHAGGQSGFVRINQVWGV
jgi:SH3-like domain-containing protein